MRLHEHACTVVGGRIPARPDRLLSTNDRQSRMETNAVWRSELRCLCSPYAKKNVDRMQRLEAVSAAAHTPVSGRSAEASARTTGCQPATRLLSPEESCASVAGRASCRVVDRLSSSKDSTSDARSTVKCRFRRRKGCSTSRQDSSTRTHVTTSAAGSRYRYAIWWCRNNSITGWW